MLDLPPPTKKKITKIVSVLLSALVERVGVSCMRDFFYRHTALNITVFSPHSCSFHIYISVTKFLETDFIFNNIRQHYSKYPVNIPIKQLQ